MGTEAAPSIGQFMRQGATGLATWTVLENFELA